MATLCDRFGAPIDEPARGIPTGWLAAVMATMGIWCAWVGVTATTLPTGVWGVLLLAGASTLVARYGNFPRLAWRVGGAAVAALGLTTGYFLFASYGSLAPLGPWLVAGAGVVVLAGGAGILIGQGKATLRPPRAWRSWIAITLVTLSTALVFTQNLDLSQIGAREQFAAHPHPDGGNHPSPFYFDESYYVYFAHQMAEGVWEDPCWNGDSINQRPLNWEHPPLAKLILAASVKLFDVEAFYRGCRDPDTKTQVANPPCFVAPNGTRFSTGQSCFDAFRDVLRDSGSTWSWRLPTAAMGTLAVLGTALATRRLMRSATAGALAGALLALDGMMFTSSRIALLDVFAAGFAALSLWCATIPTWRGRVGAGLFLGLAFSSKYTALFVGPAVLLVAWWSHHRDGRLTRRAFDTSLLAIVGIPLVVWLLTYIPWWIMWTARHGFDWSFVHWTEVQAAAFKWGTTGQFKHPYASTPAEWFLIDKPVYYYLAYDIRGAGSGIDRFIFGIPNPILWWASALASLVIFGWALVAAWHAWVASRGERQKRAAAPVPLPATSAPVEANLPSYRMVASRLPPPTLAAWLAGLSVLCGALALAGFLGPRLSGERLTMSLAAVVLAALSWLVAGLWLGVAARHPQLRRPLWACFLPWAASSLPLVAGYGWVAWQAKASVMGITNSGLAPLVLPEGLKLLLVLQLVLFAATAAFFFVTASRLVAPALVPQVVSDPRRPMRLPGTPAGQALLLAGLIPLMSYAGFLVLQRSSFSYYMTVIVPLLALGLAAFLWAFRDRPEPFVWIGGGLFLTFLVPVLVARVLLTQPPLMDRFGLTHDDVMLAANPHFTYWVGQATSGAITVCGIFGWRSRHAKLAARIAVRLVVAFVLVTFLNYFPVLEGTPVTDAVHKGLVQTLPWTKD
ncbi:MAG: glycosyltransferase family 39 protein [Thermoplasmatota archaeon]